MTCPCCCWNLNPALLTPSSKFVRSFQLWKNFPMSPYTKAECFNRNWGRSKSTLAPGNQLRCDRGDGLSLRSKTWLCCLTNYVTLVTLPSSMQFPKPEAQGFSLTPPSHSPSTCRTFLLGFPSKYFPMYTHFLSPPPSPVT